LTSFFVDFTYFVNLIILKIYIIKFYDIICLESRICVEKKSNKGLIGLIVLLIILFFIVLALVGYIIWDKTNNQKTEISTTTTTIPIQTTKNVVDNSKYDQENLTDSKNIVLDFQQEHKNNVMEIGFGLFETLTENKYKVNLTINNIKTNNKSHIIKILNFEPNDYDCEEGVEKVVYFDDKIIFEPSGEDCYLAGLSEIILFKDKYVILPIGIQDSGLIKIFNENGIEIKIDDNIVVQMIKTITNDSIIFNGWDRTEQDLECLDNEYELKIENDIVSYKLIKKGTNHYCH